MFKITNDIITSNGEPIVGQTDGEGFGRHLSLNHDGSILVVGNKDDNLVKTYKNNSDIWELIGTPFVDEGSIVALNSTGNHLVIGNPTHNNNKGKTRVYKLF